MHTLVPGSPPSPAEAALLHERYRGDDGARSRGLGAYYAVKPLLPRGVQVALRRAAARRQRAVAFPAWPIEPALLRLRADGVRAALAADGADGLPFVHYWPGGARFAYVLTHDVEGRAGVEAMGDLLEIERRHGMVSSWNFCADWYPLEERDLDVVRRAGCEVGSHGIRHDGLLFQTRATFEANLPLIAEQLRAWGAVGFRSPAVRRNADWMHELPCAYDSSFPDSDPFQPQPGGCCSIHPYFFGDVVELPVTLDQDFTVFELLRERTIRLWTDKARWIADQHGLVNVIVHPDYMTPERLARYDELLGFLAGLEGGWHALPRDVAAWWRRRERLRCIVGEDGEARIEGPGAEEARVARAWPDGDGLRHAL